MKSATLERVAPGVTWVTTGMPTLFFWSITRLLVTPPCVFSALSSVASTAMVNVTLCAAHAQQAFSLVCTLVPHRFNEVNLSALKLATRQRRLLDNNQVLYQGLIARYWHIKLVYSAGDDTLTAWGKLVGHIMGCAAGAGPPLWRRRTWGCSG